MREFSAGPGTFSHYRITCFFVDRDHRRKGVAALALAGALDLIAKAGGGVVEAYPQDVRKKTSASFLYNGTRSMFERAGFDYELTGRENVFASYRRGIGAAAPHRAATHRRSTRLEAADDTLGRARSARHLAAQSSDFHSLPAARTLR